MRRQSRCLVAAALLLVACGGDDAEDEPTRSAGGLGLGDDHGPLRARRRRPSLPHRRHRPGATSAPAPVVANRADATLRMAALHRRSRQADVRARRTNDLRAHVPEHLRRDAHTDSARTSTSGSSMPRRDGVDRSELYGAAGDVPGEVAVALAHATVNQAASSSATPAMRSAAASRRYGVAGQLDWCPGIAPAYEGRGSVCDPAAIRRSSPTHPLEITRNAESRAVLPVEPFCVARDSVRASRGGRGRRRGRGSASARRGRHRGESLDQRVGGRGHREPTRGAVSPLSDRLDRTVRGRSSASRAARRASSR